MRDNHGHWCNCPLCKEAYRTSQKMKRNIPQSVRLQLQEKNAKREEEDMKKGLMEIECPSCHHFIKVKIARQIRCYRCYGDIK